MSILDASAIIALLDREAGHEAVADAIGVGAGVCTANLGEVAARLARKGAPAERVRALIDSLPLSVYDLTRDLALSAGLLYSATRALGLSMGDRFCLALAAREDMPVLTGDRAWSRAGPLIGVTVRLFR